MLKKFLRDESGASATKVGLFGSGITLLAYGWFHTGGAMIFDFTRAAQSVMATAISHVIGRSYWF
jgi:Flp pilus assembly pilin Flp